MKHAWESSELNSVPMLSVVVSILKSKSHHLPPIAAWTSSFFVELRIRTAECMPGVESLVAYQCQHTSINVCWCVLLSTTSRKIYFRWNEMDFAGACNGRTIGEGAGIGEMRKIGFLAPAGSRALGDSKSRRVVGGNSRTCMAHQMTASRSIPRLASRAQGPDEVLSTPVTQIISGANCGWMGCYSPPSPHVVSIALRLDNEHTSSNNSHQHGSSTLYELVPSALYPPPDRFSRRLSPCRPA
jgi:hypothetical protein